MAFQIRPNKKETENKTIRFTISLLEKIDNTIKNKDVSFSKFVIQTCEYALNNMETEKGNAKKKRLRTETLIVLFLKLIFTYFFLVILL